MTNQADRRDFDGAASQNAQDNFNRVAARLESLIEQRDADVRSAMSDYRADGVSEEYAAKEQRWKNAATGVREIVSTLRRSLEQSDQTAQTTARRAKAAVDDMG